MDPPAWEDYEVWSIEKCPAEPGAGDPTERDALLGTAKSQKKLAYPKSVFLIFLTEICERFSFFGMRAVLIMYLTSALGFSNATGTIIYHCFVVLTYFFPLVFGIIADTKFGKFRTILYLSIVYSCGDIVLSLAATPSLHIPAVLFSLLGLFLLSVGAGGIKSCVASFGGDQFQLPEQEKQLDQFFYVFYFAVNFGSVLSILVTPLLRNDQGRSYTLAFGVPAGLMLLATAIFLVGIPFYKIKNAEQNVVVQAGGCIARAISKRRSVRKLKNEHWLDVAGDVYDQQFISDLKQLLNILVLFIPFPVFWALFDQQGSTWTLQATKMNGYLFDGWKLEPDQMQALNPMLILVLIPLFEQVIYPLLGKCGLFKTYLQRMTLGAFLVTLGFSIAGVVELKIQSASPVLPSNTETNFNFINTIPCTLNISLSADPCSQGLSDRNSISSPITYNIDSLLPLESFVFKRITALRYEVSIKPTRSCVARGDRIQPGVFKMDSQPGKEISILLLLNGTNQISLNYQTIGENLIVKSNSGVANLRVMYAGLEIENTTNLTLELKPSGKTKSSNKTLHKITNEAGTIEIQATEYSILLHGQSRPYSTFVVNTSLRNGGSYLLALFPDYEKNSYLPMMKLYLLGRSYSISMLYLLPQFIIITVAEVLFAITGYTLAYTQAPKSMKAIIMAAWIVTDGIGSVIVILVTASQVLTNQASQFFFFSALMLLATILFIVLAVRYKPIETKN